MLESMLKMKFTVWLFMGGSKDRGRVWLCLAAHCSQDAFNFLIFSLALPKTSGYWQESTLI